VVVFTPPSRVALPIFTDEDSEPHARATVAVLAVLAQSQHAITQFVAYYGRRWWSNLDRSAQILWRNHDPTLRLHAADSDHSGNNGIRRLKSALQARNLMGERDGLVWRA
jgi:hypothetical protein